MATSAFKSTTTRTPIGASPYADDSGISASSAKAHRRSRSLSRFSRRVLEPESDAAEPPSKGKFVNTVRGSGFPEISLDDLAIEFFSVKDEREDGRESERGRSERRRSSVISSRVAAPTESSERRGRSVSRQRSAVGDRKNVGRSVSRQRSGVGDGRSAALCGGGSGGRIGSDASSRRRRRSVSVVRCQISDSESDIDHPRNSINHGRAKSTTGGNSQMPSLQKPTDLSHRRLGRSLSQKDLSKNGYSSQSSALTDDEAKEICSGKNMIEKTIRAVYAQKKGEHPTGDDANSGLYEAMRKELRYAVDEIKMELEHARVRTTSTLESESFLQSDNSDDRRAVSKVRKGYTTKLEQSEKRKQDLVADIVLEKQRGMDLPKIVRGSVPGPKSSAIAEKPSRARKSNDRNRLSKRLSEEAEMYFEDFISNVEDTDFSSFDGERSDTSSILGVTKTRDAVFQTVETETFQSPTGSISRPGEMDGVNLPWLQWETSNDGSPLPSEDNRVLPVTPKSRVWDAAQVSAQDLTGHSTGSWSPGLDSASSSTREGSVSILKEVESRQRSEFNMDRYLNLKREEDLLFERWRERNQISSGGLLLCSNTFI